MKHGCFRIRFASALILCIAGTVSVKGQALDINEQGKLLNLMQDTNADFQNFTYGQLKEWMENQTKVNFEEYPRLYPFCVTSEQIRDSIRTKNTAHIKHFEKIIERLERVREKFYNFNQSKHFFDTSVNSSYSWIENVIGKKKLKLITAIKFTWGKLLCPVIIRRSHCRGLILLN